MYTYIYIYIYIYIYNFAHQCWRVEFLKANHAHAQNDGHPYVQEDTPTRYEYV